MREYSYKMRLKPCLLFLSLLAIVILIVIELHTSINQQFSSALKDEVLAHLPPVIVKSASQPISSSSLRLLPISTASTISASASPAAVATDTFTDTASTATATDNASTATASGSTSGRQSVTSAPSRGNHNHNIPLISSRTAMMKLVDVDTSIIWIPSEKPDPNPLLHMARAWTDVNGTEIASLQPNDPIHSIRNGSCPVTSQLQLLLTSSDNNNNGSRGGWKVRSLDINGKRKTVGGDEFYVTYKDVAALRQGSVGHPLRLSPTAVAYANDQGDGSYELDFYMSPLSSVPLEQLVGRGELTISMQYTCGVGMIPNNKKAKWGSGGLLGKVVYIVPVPIRPTIAKFVQPNADKAIDLGKYKKVLVFGDSNMEAFALPVTKLCRKNKTQKQKHPTKEKDCNMKWTTNVNSQLSMHYLRKRFLPGIRTMINATFAEGNIALEEMAVVVGSHSWDMIYDGGQGRDFKNHRQAVKTLLTTIRGEYPTMDLYWRSAMAVHTHAATNLRDDWHQIKPVYYLSTSRARNLYEFQKQIITEINSNSNSNSTVRHLDVYHASYLSAEYMQWADARHFLHYWNIMATNWFYRKPRLL